MIRDAAKIILAMAGLSLTFSVEAAVDSYRFFHVTISTPWYLFIFLLGGVFAPFILMAVLAWHTALRKSKNKADNTAAKFPVE